MGVDLLYCRLVIFVLQNPLGLPDTNLRSPVCRAHPWPLYPGDAMEAPSRLMIEMRRVEVHLPCSDGLAIEAWQMDSQGVHNWNFKICQASNVATGYPPFSGDVSCQDSTKCHQFQCWH